jgi:hypothetical protein
VATRASTPVLAVPCATAVSSASTRTSKRVVNVAVDEITRAPVAGGVIYIYPFSELASFEVDEAEKDLADRLESALRGFEHVSRQRSALGRLLRWHHDAVQHRYEVVILSRQWHGSVTVRLA